MGGLDSEPQSWSTFETTSGFRLGSGLGEGVGLGFVLRSKVGVRFWDLYQGRFFLQCRDLGLESTFWNMSMDSGSESNF